jgi:two-component system, NarL family, response regulator DevR
LEVPVREGRVRILIIDRQPLFREAAKLILEEAEGLEVVGVARGASEGLAISQEVGADLALLDQDLPEAGPPGAVIRLLRDQDPSIRVVLVGTEDLIDGLAGAVEAGADGYVSRTAGATEFLNQVRGLAEGFLSLPEPTAEALRQKLKARRAVRRRKADLLSELSEEERKLASLLADGATLEEIADRLNATERAARASIRKLLSACGVTSIPQLREILEQEAET